MLTKEKKTPWDKTKDLLDHYHMEFGNHWSYNFRNDPKRLGFVLSRYKFAAKMASKKQKVLELGCSDGIGSTILAEQAVSYTGVDYDPLAIEAAKKNLQGGKWHFICDDFMEKSYGQFDAIVSMDVIEHILPEFEDQYLQTIVSNLSSEGICVIGTPNITASAYASVGSQIGHVNLYSQDRFVQSLQKYFHQVLPFGMNDEILHTGYAPMCHYLICVACLKK